MYRFISSILLTEDTRQHYLGGWSNFW